MKFWISTIDNRFDPITDFDKWYDEDLLKGHNTCAIIDRLSYTSSQFTEEENERIIEKAIDTLIATDPINWYFKVRKGNNYEELRQKMKQFACIE